MCKAAALRCLAPSMLLLASAAFAGTGAASEGAQVSVRLVIHDHRFVPEEIHVPAGHQIVLEVENADAAVEEFESYDLDREQRVPPGGVVSLRLQGLSKGRYSFFGDFHRKTAQGVLVVD